MASATKVLLFFFISVLTITSTTAQFRCATSGRTCNSIVGYVSPNTTTLSAIVTLFQVDNFNSFLGVNNLPLSTLPNRTVNASQTIRIPFQCRCTNGSGMSNGRPRYRVVPDDGLYHIAAEVFSGLVTFQQIQAVNNISNANFVRTGQELWIPLPCSCDEVDGQRVVHYGLVVANGSSVEGIAQEYGTSNDTLLRLNGLASPNDLRAGAVLDVPLRACRSMVSNDSLDYPLLVPNNTYVLTATNCVTCNCDAANNWTLQCHPSGNRSAVCPSMQCQGAENLSLGNTTSSTCNTTVCAYAGYTNQTIHTTLALESTCPAPNNFAPKLGLQG